jgi:hypothetical protein
LTRRRATALLALLAASLAATWDAAPAAIVRPACGAPGPVAVVNGREAPAATPLSLRAGDRVEARSDPVTLRVAEGGEIRLSPGAVVTHQGVTNGVEYLFVVSGTAEGDLGQATALGAPASWALAAGAERCTVRVSVGKDGPADASDFLAVRGEARLRYHAIAALLPAGCRLELAPSGDGPASLSFGAAAGNPASIELTRSAARLSHAVTVPPGVSGTLADRGAATRVSCGRAPAGGLLRLEVRSDGAAVRRGAVGPGAAALLASDEVRIEVPAAGARRLADLRAQVPEFTAR